MENEAVAVDAGKIVMIAAAPASLASASRSTHGRGRPMQPVQGMHNKTTLVPLLLGLHLQVTCPGRQSPSKERGTRQGYLHPQWGWEHATTRQG